MAFKTVTKNYCENVNNYRTVYNFNDLPPVWNTTPEYSENLPSGVSVKYGDDGVEQITINDYCRNSTNESDCTPTCESQTCNKQTCKVTDSSGESAGVKKCSVGYNPCDNDGDCPRYCSGGYGGFGCLDDGDCPSVCMGSDDMCFKDSDCQRGTSVPGCQWDDDRGCTTTIVCTEHDSLVNSDACLCATGQAYCSYNGNYDTDTTFQICDAASDCTGYCVQGDEGAPCDYDTPDDWSTQCGTDILFDTVGADSTGYSDYMTTIETSDCNARLATEDECKDAANALSDYTYDTTVKGSTAPYGCYVPSSKPGYLRFNTSKDNKECTDADGAGTECVCATLGANGRSCVASGNCYDEDSCKALPGFKSTVNEPTNPSGCFVTKSDSVYWNKAENVCLTFQNVVDSGGQSSCDYDDPPKGNTCANKTGTCEYNPTPCNDERQCVVQRSDKNDCQNGVATCVLPE